MMDKHLADLKVDYLVEPMGMMKVAKLVSEKAVLKVSMWVV